MLLGLGAIVASTQGCGDDTAARIRAARLAEGCAIDSDCVDPLVCAFAHCHGECSADKDCKDLGGRCVRAPDGLGVCQLESERDCTARGCVIAGEICAEDDQCRDVCSAQKPCFPGLVCSRTGECAQAAELDADGYLLGGHGGARGAAGDSSQGSSGGGASARGDSGSGPGGRDDTNGGTAGGHHAGTTGGGGGDRGRGEAGNPASGAEAGDGVGGGGNAGGMSSGGMSTGGMSGRGASAGASGGGEVAEQEPNDDRNAPMSVTPGTTVHGSIDATTDTDYFEVATPAEPAGGYYTYSVAQAAGGAFVLDVLSGVDFAPVVAGVGQNSGASRFGYFPAAPGDHFLFQMKFKSGSALPNAYELAIHYTAAVDAREPDDTRSSATELALDTPARALIFAGFHGSSLVNSDYFDYYALTLAAGPYTATLTTMPAEISGSLQLFSSAGTALKYVEVGTGGEDVVMSGTISTPGTYYVQVGSNSNNDPSPSGTTSFPDEVPEYFTKPYTLTVTQ